MEIHDREYFISCMQMQGFEMVYWRSVLGLWPGLTLSVVITLAAKALEYLEVAVLGFPWIDGLVFAIILGTLLHTMIGLHASLRPGVGFASKFLLEIAIVLLGASISAATIAGAGLTMVATIAGVVLTSLLVSYGIGRALGLSDRLATLVACGNSICGNSAIVAAAPVIDANSDDVAASIAFTAALGILVVILLPIAFTVFGLTKWQYGIVAGMTVYAVPQVLAATIPVGAISTQVGTLVKLMRVLMLGPVILLLGLKSGGQANSHLSLRHLVPWFIVGFIAMMLLRSAGLIPQQLLPSLNQASVALTTVAMAALGLSVNLRSVLASGGRVLAAGTLSILALAALSALALIVLPA
jgi:uncharacterized integral membrane protein (TIGR00698 family)